MGREEEKNLSTGAGDSRPTRARVGRDRATPPVPVRVSPMAGRDGGKFFCPVGVRGNPVTPFIAASQCVVTSGTETPHASPRLRHRHSHGPSAVSDASQCLSRAGGAGTVHVSGLFILP